MLAVAYQLVTLLQESIIMWYVLYKENAINLSNEPNWLAKMKNNVYNKSLSN